MDGKLIPVLSEQYANQYDFAVEVIEGTLNELDLDLGGKDKDEKEEFELLVSSIARKLLGKRPRIKKAKKAAKDPKAPKRPPSAYLIFCDEQRNAIKESNPGIKPNLVMKLLGADWAKLDKVGKEPYERRRAELLREYEVLKEKYENGPSEEEEEENSNPWMNW